MISQLENKKSFLGLRHTPELFFVSWKEKERIDDARDVDGLRVGQGKLSRERKRKWENYFPSFSYRKWNRITCGDALIWIRKVFIANGNAAKVHQSWQDKILHKRNLQSLFNPKVFVFKVILHKKFVWKALSDFYFMNLALSVRNLLERLASKKSLLISSISSLMIWDRPLTLADWNAGVMSWMA